MDQEEMTNAQLFEKYYLSLEESITEFQGFVLTNSHALLTDFEYTENIYTLFFKEIDFLGSLITTKEEGLLIKSLIEKLMDTLSFLTVDQKMEDFHKNL